MTEDGSTSAVDPADRQPAPEAERASRSWLSRYGPQSLVGALIVAVVGSGVGALVTSFTGGDGDGGKAGPQGSSPPAAVTASCFNATCAGADPKHTRCGDDAVNLADDARGTMHVYVRYSPRCQTVWGKLIGAQVGDTVEIATSPKRRELAKVNEGHTNYTPMLPVGPEFWAQAKAVSVKGDPDQDLPARSELLVGANQDDVSRATHTP